MSVIIGQNISTRYAQQNDITTCDAMPIAIKASAGLWLPVTEIATQKGIPHLESLSADISYWFGLQTGLGFRHRYSHKEYPYGLIAKGFYYNMGSFFLDLRYDFLRKSQFKFGVAISPAVSFVVCRKYFMGDTEVLPRHNGATFVELSGGLFANIPLKKSTEITFDLSATLPTSSASNPQQEYVEVHVEPYITLSIGLKFKVHSISNIKYE